MASQTHRSPHSLYDILRRTALPFFLFSAVLLSLLLVSWFALVPELTSIEIAGEKRNLQELKEYTIAIEEEITAMEEKRNAFLLPVQDPQFLALRADKHAAPPFMDLLSDIGRIAARIHPDIEGTVSLSLFSVDVAEGTATVHGDVRNVGLRSMTVLAEFVDAVSALPDIGTVEASKYVRKEHPDYGPYSPFTLTIALHDDA